MAEKNRGQAKPDPKGTAKPDPKDTTQTSAALDKGKTAASTPEVEAQRQQEQEQALAAAAAAQPGTAGPASPAQKGQQTRAAADVRADAAASVEARAEAAEAEEGVSGKPEPVDTSSEDAVQRQRREEAEARTAAAAKADADLTDEDRRLLAAAPGGERTALTDGREGSTTVTHTAAQSRPPLSGPLDAPVTGIENYAATEDDADNRVYADVAGPRDVFEDTEPTKARFIDADGEALDYDDIFEDVAGKTYVVSKTRVYEEFLFPNTTEYGRRLAYPRGKRVPRGEAENIRQQISVHSPIL